MPIYLRYERTMGAFFVLKILLIFIASGFGKEQA